MKRVFIRYRQIFTFLVGGSASAIIDVVIMQLVLLGSSRSVYATSAGFFSGLIFNYGFHARRTFKTKIDSHNMIRYLCIVALNYAITLGIVEATIAFGGKALIGKLIALPLVALTTFYTAKYWIFR